MIDIQSSEQIFEKGEIVLASCKLFELWPAKISKIARQATGNVYQVLTYEDVRNTRTYYFNQSNLTKFTQQNIFKAKLLYPNNKKFDVAVKRGKKNKGKRQAYKKERQVEFGQTSKPKTTIIGTNNFQLQNTHTYYTAIQNCIEPKDNPQNQVISIQKQNPGVIKLHRGWRIKILQHLLSSVKETIYCNYFTIKLQSEFIFKDYSQVESSIIYLLKSQYILSKDLAYSSIPTIIIDILRLQKMTGNKKTQKISKYLYLQIEWICESIKSLNTTKPLYTHLIMTIMSQFCSLRMLYDQNYEQ